MVFFCLSEDCFDSNHSDDGHFTTRSRIMEAHSGGRDYHQTRNPSYSSNKGPATSLPSGQQMPISMSQSAIISSQQLSNQDHRQQFSSSQELEDKYNEKYLDKYNTDSCSKQMGLQIGLQPKHSSNQFHKIAENDSEILSVASPMPPNTRTLQRHYSVVDPKNFPENRGAGNYFQINSVIAGKFSFYQF